MKKQYAFAAAVIVVALVGCTSEEAATEQKNPIISTSEYSYIEETAEFSLFQKEFKVKENQYFDLSDITVDIAPLYQILGNSKAYSYYDFGEEDCPECEYFTAYSSPDYEQFAFDDEGRLRSYIYYAADNRDQNCISEEELKQICTEVLEACVEDIGIFRVESGYNDNGSRYYMKITYSCDQRDDMDIHASVELCLNGDIRTVDCYYETELSAEERAFFDENVAEYVSVRQNEVYDYTYEGQYHRIDGKLYGFIDVSLKDEASDDKDEDSFLMEYIGFVK